MNYCKKCLRVLNEGERFCAACGEAVVETAEKPAGTDVSAQLNELNTIIEENKTRKEASEAVPAPAPYAQPVQTAKPYSQPIDLSASGVYQKPEPPAYHTVPMSPPEPDVPAATKVLLTILSVLIAPAGIIIGIVNMNNKSKAYKSFGQTLLIVGITQMAIILLCCCIGSLFSSGIATFMEEIMYYY